MRLTLNWLKDYVDIDLLPDELADLLTMAGLEVEALEPLGQGLGDVVAARVVSFEKHPQADRLTVCRVDAGGETADVVCGAPNVRVGMMTAYAPPGVRLPGGLLVKETRIRGQASRGILLAEDEMGLTDDHSGIMDLFENPIPGTSINRCIPIEDWALEIGLTPNRPDCASVIGIAREVAALTGKTLRRPELPNIASGGSSIEEHASVTIEDPLGCPRYSAGLVRGVKIGSSPFWMRYRLHSSGVRSINNVVDVTNYVMLECGQPLHAFDFHRLRENRIVVRRAQEGEIFKTLDGQDRTLTPDDLMICDGEGSVALAGVMGGLNSEIEKDPRHVLVESACFDPITIRRTSKKLDLSSEASYRFERGVDIEGTVWALRRSMLLLAEAAGGAPDSGIIDRYPRPRQPIEITLRVHKTNSFLGTSLTADSMAAYLSSLELEVQRADHGLLLVKPPACRVDLVREADLMEEVARMMGYDRIPVTLPAVRPDDEPEPVEVCLGDRIREIMAGFGFSEIITFSFISEEGLEALGATENHPLGSTVKLLKPLSRDQAVMRTTLLPGLLQSAGANMSYGERNLRLFEWGKIFLPLEESELPREELKMAAVLIGSWTSRTLHEPERPVDFYDMKGVLESLLGHLFVEGTVFKRADPPPGFHRSNTAQVLRRGTTLGWVGELAPDAAERFEIGPEKAFLMELDAGALQEAMPADRLFKAYARVPAVVRDMCVVVDKSVESESVREIIAGAKLVESVELFDLYHGDQLSPSEKALTFRVCFRSRNRTLKGREINALHEKIVRKIQEQVGGRLRDR